MKTLSVVVNALPFRYHLNLTLVEYEQFINSTDILVDMKGSTAIIELQGIIKKFGGKLIS